MNHILRLQDELRAADLMLHTMKEELHELRMYLATDKFHGCERDGSRKDWIAIDDIDQRLRDILMTDPLDVQEEKQERSNH